MPKKFTPEVREYRRTAFDDVSILYDEVRPGYPEELYTDLIALSGIPERGSILEIGAGTGQATLPLAERGYHITALELGENLAAVAQDKLRDYPKAVVLNTSFEKWDLTDEPFDLLIAATAFHWIDPEVRFKKSAAAVKKGGAIGIFGSWHATQKDKEFIETTAPIYERYMPPKESYEIPPIIPTSEEVEGGGFFNQSASRAYEWSAKYSTIEYLRLINTYSEHRRLPAIKREDLFKTLTETINRKFGGYVIKHYTTGLIVANKR